MYISCIYYIYIYFISFQATCQEGDLVYKHCTYLIRPYRARTKLYLPYLHCTIYTIHILYIYYAYTTSYRTSIPVSIHIYILPIFLLKLQFYSLLFRFVLPSLCVVLAFSLFFFPYLFLSLLKIFAVPYPCPYLIYHSIFF